MLLCSAEEARDLVEGLKPGAATDALLGTLIGRAEPLLARYCGYPESAPGTAPSLIATNYTRYSGDGRVARLSDRELRLLIWPVLSVASVFDDTAGAFGADTEVVAEGRVQRGARGEIVQLVSGAERGTWSTSAGAIRATWSAGYAADAIPGDLKQACAEMALHWFGFLKRRGLVSQSTEVGTTTYLSPTMPPHVREILSPFRLPSVYL